MEDTAMNGDIVWQPAMVKCVCGHFHADSCPCGCSYPEEDLGGFGSPAGTTNYSNAHNKYTGQYIGPYTLDQETA